MASFCRVLVPGAELQKPIGGGMMEAGRSETRAMRLSHWRVHLLILVVYTLLALVLTWPLVAHFGTHVPGNGADDPPLTWNLWWIRHSLLDLQANPFDCTYLFYPLGINLAFYTLTLLNGLLSIPLQPILGLVAASNLLLLSSFVLGAYGAFLLVYYLLGSASGEQAAAKDWLPAHGQATVLAASMVAGLLYAFASSKLFYAALGQWNVASSQWMPYYILVLGKLARHPWKWRHLFLAALFLLLQAYAELTYASFLALYTLLWGLWQGVTALRRGQAGRLPKLALGLVLVGCVTAIGLVPVLAEMIPDLRVEGDILIDGEGFADVFSADLLGFLVPTMLHPLFGSLVDKFHFDHTVGQHLYLGYSVLLLASVGVVVSWRRSEARFWLLSAVLFWLLTLGPRLRIDGRDTGVGLPFALVAQLPFFEGNRYPSRYSVLLMLSLAVLAAFGLNAILKRLARPGSAAPPLMTGFVVALFLMEHLSMPLPLSDLRVPAVYDWIAEMPGDSTLLDLPVAWRNGFRVTGTLHPIIMFEQYYQTAHGRPVLAGNTSRNPPLKFQYFTEAPVVNTLLALETGHSVDPVVAERDRLLAADVLRFFDIEAIVVDPARAGPATVAYLEATLPVRRSYDDGQKIGYEVELPPYRSTWLIEPGEALSRLSFGEGWGMAVQGEVWAQRRAVQLLVPLNGDQQEVSFRAFAPEAGQGLRVEANTQTVARIDLAAGRMEYRFTLPREAVHQGLNEVWFYFDLLFPVSQARNSPRLIGQTGSNCPVNLVVQSAGQEVGDFGHIFVDGRDLSLNGRGYNVVVLDSKSGELVDRATFDTHLDGEASRAMAVFLAAVPPGSIVAVAAADEASRLLEQPAVTALQEIGAVGDMRGKFRWGHAIIGVQGAPPGTALEALDWMRPVSLVVGEGLTEPEAAAAFGGITFNASTQ